MWHGAKFEEKGGCVRSSLPNWTNHDVGVGVSRCVVIGEEHLLFRLRPETYA